MLYTYVLSFFCLFFKLPPCLSPMQADLKLIWNKKLQLLKERGYSSILRKNSEYQSEEEMS